MRNSINWLTNIAVGIWDYITGGFRILFNAVNELQQAAMIRIRRYFIFLFCGNIVALAILLLGLILHSGTVIVISAMIAASMLLLTYIAFIVPAAVISFFAGDILGRSKFKCIEGAARSALFPVLSCSFFISALASILASAGIKSIPFWTVVVYGAFALVLIVLSFFSKEKSMTTHYLVLVLVIWNFLIFIFPMPTKSVILTVANTVNKWSVKDKTSAEGQIVLVVEGAKLYKMNDDDEFIQSGLNIKESRAKVVDWEKDSESGEDVYKVFIDSSGQDNFIGIEPVFVSLRAIKLIEQPNDKPVQNVENSSQNIQNISLYPTRTFSPTGTKETLYFKDPGDVKETSIIYLAPGQRIRVFASTNCKIYNSKIDVKPRVWKSFDQTVEGLVSVEGVGEKGSITIEVM